MTTLEDLTGAYLSHLAKDQQPSTMEVNRRLLSYFLHWCDDRGYTLPSHFNRSAARHYQRYLYEYRKENGEPLSFQTQSTRLARVRHLFDWLVREGHHYENPTAPLDLPKKRRKGRPTLTLDEIERILTEPDLTTIRGLRDKALMETLFATAVKRPELQAIRLSHLDLEEGYLTIPESEPLRPRTVPISPRAVTWIQKYLDLARPHWTKYEGEDHLFITERGRPLSIGYISEVVRTHRVEAGIERDGGPNLFRNAAAALMLKAGAELRYVQEYLGHRDPENTRAYYRGNLTNLKKVHTNTHPAKLRKNKP